MAQIQSNGAAVPRQVFKDAFAAIMTPEEAKAIKEAMLSEAPRMMAEIMAREAVERPKIAIDEAGKLVPKDFDQLFRIAVWIESLKLYGVKEKGGGTRLYSVPEIAAIVAAGLRVGMDPFYALETIALINNKTCIFGRGVRGVVMASGLCEDWTEQREGFSADGVPSDKAKVTVTLRRKGIPTPFVGTFSVANAVQAGLWSASEYSPWKKYPGDMLTWRAVSRAVLGFSDVLGGMTLAEEAVDQEQQEAERPAAALNSRLAAMDDTTGEAGAGREVVLPSAPAPGATEAAPFEEASKLAEVVATRRAEAPAPGESLGGADAQPPADFKPRGSPVPPSQRRNSAPKGNIFSGGGQ